MSETYSDRMLRRQPEPERVIAKVQCPYCHSVETHVTSTQTPIRYRVCDACKKHFKTISGSPPAKPA